LSRSNPHLTKQDVIQRDTVFTGNGHRMWSAGVSGLDADLPMPVGIRLDIRRGVEPIARDVHGLAGFRPTPDAYFAISL